MLTSASVSEARHVVLEQAARKPRVAREATARHSQAQAHTNQSPDADAGGRNGKSREERARRGRGVFGRGLSVGRVGPRAALELAGVTPPRKFSSCERLRPTTELASELATC